MTLDSAPSATTVDAAMAMKCTSATHSEALLPRTPASRERIKQAIGLLEAAARQLYAGKAEHSTLVQAASVLRDQISLQSPEQSGARRGRLLAWQVRKVLTYIDSHITDRLLVADLSSVARCSDSHFSRQFARTFGFAPHAFVLRRRVELAARRILDTQTPLSDVALTCGFTDQAHLSKCFRRVMGDTPSSWRRTHSAREAEAAISELSSS